MSRDSSVRLEISICALLIAAVAVIYWQTSRFDFVNYDDPAHVYGNPAVRAGLTIPGVRHAMTVPVVGNWMPLTILSYMADVELFGVNPGAIHLTNVVIHALSAILLFMLLLRATNCIWPSAAVALFFAVHPLHVESVGWISERKDVLSAFFFFLGLYFYIEYQARRSAVRYLAVVVAFMLGLMSKAMGVTFPFVLLLIDYWPLRRTAWRRWIVEKLPLFALSGIACYLAYTAQRFSGAVALRLAWNLRIEKALVSYMIYLGQSVWPAGLVFFYPSPGKPDALAAGAAAAVLIAICIAVWRLRRKLPYLLTGWFWFSGTLIPVIGLVPIGQQAHADRYLYIPLAGLSMMIAWGAIDLIQRWPIARWPMIATAATAAALCAVLAFEQTGTWRDSESLYQQALRVNNDNWVAHANLGSYLMDKPGRRYEAIRHLDESIRLNPDAAESHNNLGVLLTHSNLWDAAIPHFEAALQSHPEMYQARTNLGVSLVRAGRDKEGIEALQGAIRDAPGYADAHLYLAAAMASGARDAEAVSEYEAAIRLNPSDARAHRELAPVLEKLGRTDEAIAHLSSAQLIDPDAQTAAHLDKLRGAPRRPE